ncbi:MAG TPA: hypothetical protein VFF03_15030 [Rhodocyclaceae bacterium]|nr:hypothetical protein [Rhodocyclaceae bacterium]
MSEKGKNLVAICREAARSLQAKMIPGLSDLLNALADYVEELEGKNATN